MATPSHKAAPVGQLLEGLFGRTSAITADICVSCAKPATTFTDALSRREYGISGLCQQCQDAVFDVGEEQW